MRRSARIPRDKLLAAVHLLYILLMQRGVGEKYPSLLHKDVVIVDNLFLPPCVGLSRLFDWGCGAHIMAVNRVLGPAQFRMAGTLFDNARG
jgi:hypothetical protein